MILLQSQPNIEIHDVHHDVNFQSHPQHTEKHSTRGEKVTAFIGANSCRKGDNDGNVQWQEIKEETSSMT